MTTIAAPFATARCRRPSQCTISESVAESVTVSAPPLPRARAQGRTRARDLARRGANGPQPAQMCAAAPRPPPFRGVTGAGPRPPPALHVPALHVRTGAPTTIVRRHDRAGSPPRQWPGRVRSRAERPRRIAAPRTAAACACGRGPASAVLSRPPDPCPLLRPDAPQRPCGPIAALPGGLHGPARTARGRGMGPA